MKISIFITVFLDPEDPLFPWVPPFVRPSSLSKQTLHSHTHTLRSILWYILYNSNDHRLDVCLHEVRYQCDYCDRDTNVKDDGEIIEDDNIAICDKVDKYRSNISEHVDDIIATTVDKNLPK